MINYKKMVVNNISELENKKIDMLMYPVIMYGKEKEKNNMYDDWDEYKHTKKLLEELQNYPNLKINIYYLEDSSVIIGLCICIIGIDYMKNFINNIDGYDNYVEDSTHFTCFHILKDYRGIGTKWLKDFVFPDLIECGIKTIYVKSSHNKAFHLYQKLGKVIGQYIGISDNKLYQRLGYIYQLNLDLEKTNNFINYAHRGASSYAPENTMSAFNKAIEIKATGIELDLQKTKDNKIVIFHDDIIDNRSNGKGRIIDYTYQELLNLDFGSWFDMKYKDEKIVLFEDFAKKFLEKDLTFAIELKVVGIEKDVLEIIKKYKKRDNIYITSFIYDALVNVRKLDNNIKLSWLVEKINCSNINKLLEIKGYQICPKATLVTEEDIQLARNNNIGVRLWGVTNEDIMKKAYKLNIEGMTVNFPDKLNILMNK